MASSSVPPNKMITEAQYMEQLRSCQKANRKQIALRQRPGPFFDPQTGIAQRPTNHLVRRACDRYHSGNPMEVCRYMPNRWQRDSKISSDSIEYRYIMSTDPALKAAADSLVNPEQPAGSTNETSNDAAPSSSKPAASARTNFENLDFEDYNEDDFDVDHSDEEDWGAKRKGRKRTTKDSSFKAPRRSGGAASSAGASSSSAAAAGAAESRPFVCTVPDCGARYKSRPGLTYHRIHVHADASGESPRSPITVPKPKPEETCETCGGGNVNNDTKLPEVLVSCRDCGRSGHPTCFGLSPNMVTSSKKFGWQCFECKSCTVCGNSDNDDKLLFCDDCDRGFHCYCLTPALDSPPKGDWSCEPCKKEFKNKPKKSAAKR